MADKGWIDLLHDHAPALEQQHRADMEFLGSATALSAREKMLIAMVLDAAANKPNGVRAYGERALKAGATKDQVLDALTVLRMFFGRPALVTGAEALRLFEKG
ncbi:MAG TPA: carboxymuconolactone decarboxylase family protein [Spirochaetia bacterium]|nr:carboxymuconolactone decarboxylase family protein [Spirochaetia bacterium]